MSGVCESCAEPDTLCRCLEPCPKCGHECDCTLPPDTTPPPDEDAVCELFLRSWGGAVLREVLTAEAPK